MSGAISLIHETVFAGLPTQTMSNGVDVTLDGLTYTPGISSGGSVKIVAAGLEIVAPSGGGAECALKLKPPGFMDLMSRGAYGSTWRGRWRNGVLGVWVRVASWNWGTATAGFWYTPGVFTTYPQYGHGARRTRSGSNSPVGMFCWRDGTDTYPSPLYGSGSNNTTADVFHLCFRSPWWVEVYYGTWAGAWPEIDAMTLGGLVTGVTTSPTVGSTLSAFDHNALLLHFGGGQTGTTSASITYDRWRLTEGEG